MSVKKGPVSVLREKAKGKAMTARMGSHRAVITRTKSTYWDKAIAMKVHRDLIHGFRHGNIVHEGGINQGAVETFHGDGLPDDSLAAIRAPATNKERSKNDKRNSITSESYEGWKPRPFGWRKAAKAAARA